MYANEGQNRHPWHLRNTVVRHHQWFDNLVELHRITLSWPETSTEDLNAITPPEDLRPSMAYLPVLGESDPRIESILQAQWPDALLTGLDVFGAGEVAGKEEKRGQSKS